MAEGMTNEIVGIPLNSLMDNVLAYRLGLVASDKQLTGQGIGDEIDRGLVLRRLLEESGFYLLKKGS